MKTSHLSNILFKVFEPTDKEMQAFNKEIGDIGIVRVLGRYLMEGSVSSSRDELYMKYFKNLFTEEYKQYSYDILKPHKLQRFILNYIGSNEGAMFINEKQKFILGALIEHFTTGENQPLVQTLKDGRTTYWSSTTVLDTSELLKLYNKYNDLEHELFKKNNLM